VTAVELTVLGEIQPGHTYAISLPPNVDLHSVIEPLRELQEITCTQTIVFAPGTNLADASNQALTDAQVKIGCLLDETSRLSDQFHERGKRLAQRCQELDESRFEAERLRAEVARLRVIEVASIGAHALLEDRENEAEQLRVELARLRRLMAAADEFGDRHVIYLGEDGWTIAHPLSCRAAGLFACPINAAAADLPSPSACEIGLFAVSLDDDGALVIGERVEREVGQR